MLNVQARAVGFCLLGLGLIACSTSDDAPTEAPVAQGLTIATHQAELFEGTFRDGEAVIRFRATQPEDDSAELTFRVGGKTFLYEAQAITEVHRGWFGVTADQSLDASDIAAAQGLLDALLPYLGEELTAISLFEASVPKMAYYLAEQQPGTFVASFSFGEEMYDDQAMPRSLNDDNKLCIRKTTTVSASYDLGTAGAATTQGVVVGSDWGTSACGASNYSCMGRCGAGCNGFGGGWTLDCLEHDACSHDRCASGGGSDANCGDEYNHASSDIFSSCSGN